jgi:hypothetical protein
MSRYCRSCVFLFWALFLSLFFLLEGCKATSCSVVDQLLLGPLFERLNRGKRKEMEGRKEGSEGGGFYMLFRLCDNNPLKNF